MNDFVLWCMIVQVISFVVCSSELIIEHKVEYGSEVGYIESPGFPTCCSSSSHGVVINITVTESFGSNDKDLYLIYTDFDIPEHSTFHVSSKNSYYFFNNIYLAIEYGQCRFFEDAE